MPLKQRVLVVAAGIICMFVLTSCADGLSPSANTTSTEEARQAAWGAERTRICLQNLTSSNLQYEFRANTVDDYANTLSPRLGTLGPNAIQCGNATDYPLATETWVRFRSDEPGAKWTYRVGFSDSSAAREQCWYWSDDMQPDVDNIAVNPYTADSVVYYDFTCFERGKRQLSGPARGGNFNLVVDIAGAPKTFGSIRAYQADVRVLPG